MCGRLLQVGKLYRQVAGLTDWADIALIERDSSRGVFVAVG